MLYKRKDLNLSTQHTCKNLGVIVHTCNSTLGEWRRRSLELSVQPAYHKPWVFCSVRDPAKGNKAENHRRHTVFSSGLSMNMYGHEYLHTQQADTQTCYIPHVEVRGKLIVIVLSFYHLDSGDKIHVVRLSCKCL